MQRESAFARDRWPISRAVISAANRWPRWTARVKRPDAVPWLVINWSWAQCRWDDGFLRIARSSAQGVRHIYARAAARRPRGERHRVYRGHPGRRHHGRPEAGRKWSISEPETGDRRHCGAACHVTRARTSPVPLLLSPVGPSALRAGTVPGSTEKTL